MILDKKSFVHKIPELIELYDNNPDFVISLEYNDGYSTSVLQEIEHEYDQAKRDYATWKTHNFMTIEIAWNKSE